MNTKILLQMNTPKIRPDKPENSQILPYGIFLALQI